MSEGLSQQHIRTNPLGHRQMLVPADQPATRNCHDLHRRIILFDFSDQFESVALRHQHIGHDHVETPAGDGQTRINSVLGARHQVTCPFQNMPKQITQLLFVINKKNGT